MRDKKRYSSRRPSSSAASAAEGDEAEGNATRTPFSSPFSYPEVEDEEEEEDDDEDDGNLLEIIIDTLTGTTFQVRVSPWETGGGLKGLLHRTQGIPSSDQHILLGQRELTDDAPLIDQGVQDGSNLKLVLAMKGGPINTGRVPHDDILWREFADYMDVNREELWDGTPGKPVTLLVLREGENVNLYRVIENQDGTFSPLNESWGSNVSSSGKTDVSTDRDSRHDDEFRHRQQMIDLNAQMEALKIRKKERRRYKNLSKPPTSKGRVAASTRTVRVRRNVPQVSKTTKDPSSLNHSLKRVPVNTRIISERPPKKVAASPFRVPISVSPTRFSSSNNSIPATQESSNTFDIRRPSISRGSKVLDEIPRSRPPKHVDFSSYRKLDSIKSQTKRNSLGPLNEDGSQATSVGVNSRIIAGNGYDNYRKSLVKHSRGLNQGDAIVSEEDSRKAWSGRDVPLPLFMDSVRPRKSRIQNRLYQSHNLSSLRPLTDIDDRPKTSPDIMVHRHGSAISTSSMSERIQLRGPDDKLRDLITILNTSRANSRLSQRSAVSPPYPSSNSKVTTAVKSFRTNKNQSGKTSMSVSLASLRGATPSLPSTPGKKNVGAAESKEQIDLLRELAKAQGIGLRPSSKRTTPEGGKKNIVKRPSSGYAKTVVSSPRGFLSSASSKKKNRNRPRCNQCSKKIGVATSYPCRCGHVFCAQHRYSEAHDCTYDYKTAGRKLIEIANPLVVPPKLPKI